MLDWLNQLGLPEKFYLACTVLGGTAFVLRSVMLFVGLGDSDAGDVDTGDADVSSVEDGSPVGDFKLLSLHSLTAFVLMFGLSGFLLLRSGCSIALAGTVSVLAGFGTMFVIARLFWASRKLQSDGTIRPQDAVGATGTVYLGIKPGAVGQVEVDVKGTRKVMDARSSKGGELKTGTPVKVVGTDGVLLVDKL
jgi:membrane protein implicated in regulation of membrane protease activity